MEIVVLDRGWVYVAREVVESDKQLRLEGARCIRRWGTTEGLAQLANEGPQPKTKLEPECVVTAERSSVMHRIECRSAVWKS